MKKVLVVLKTRDGEVKHPINNIKRIKEYGYGKSCTLDVEQGKGDDAKIIKVDCIEPFFRIRARLDQAKELQK